MKKKKRNRIKSFDTGDRVLVIGKDNKPKYNGLCGIVISSLVIDDSPCYEVYIPGYKDIVLGNKAWTSNFLCSADSLVPYDEWVKDSPNTVEFEISSCNKIMTSTDESSITYLRVEPEESVDWQDYEMTLAHDIAVAYAEKSRYEPREIGTYAVLAARSVVQNLKKKQS